MDNIDEALLKEIADIEGKINGAYNIRKNGEGIERNITPNTNIITKKEKSGIDVIVKENTKFEIVHIPVIITQSGMKDVPIGLLLGLRINYNAPITTMVCSFTGQNSHRTKL